MMPREVFAKRIFVPATLLTRRSTNAREVLHVTSKIGTPRSCTIRAPTRAHSRSMAASMEVLRTTLISFLREAARRDDARAAAKMIHSVTTALVEARREPESELSLLCWLAV